MILHAPFAGIPAGSKLFIASPEIVAAAWSRIPYGRTRTITRVRADLARRRGCDATCPASFAIFARIAAQAAVDAMAEGTPPEAVPPFWRMLRGSDRVAGKLDWGPPGGPLGRGWIDARRDLEAGAGAAS